MPWQWSSVGCLRIWPWRHRSQSCRLKADSSKPKDDISSLLHGHKYLGFEMKIISSSIPGWCGDILVDFHSRAGQALGVAALVNLGCLPRCKLTSANLGGPRLVLLDSALRHSSIEKAGVKASPRGGMPQSHPPQGCTRLHPREDLCPDGHHVSPSEILLWRCLGEKEQPSKALFSTSFPRSASRFWKLKIFPFLFFFLLF